MSDKEFTEAINKNLIDQQLELASAASELLRRERGMMKLKVWVTGRITDFEVELPAKRIVCPECDGSGHVLCDSLRGLALTAGDLDPDFSESYFGGDYDVRCHECNGKNVIEVVDEQALTSKMRERYYRAIDNRNAHLAEVQAERRRGA